MSARRVFLTDGTSPIPMSSRETRQYYFDAALMGTPSSPSMYVIDESTGQDVVDTVTTGNLDISGTDIQYKELTGLTSGHTYQVGLVFTVGVNVFDRFFYQQCSDE